MARKRRQSRANKRNRERALNNALARQIEPVEGEPIRQVARTQTMLERLHQRHVINTEQREAGDRLFGHLITNYSRLDVPRQRGRGHPRDADTPAQIDARRRFERAIGSLNGAADVVMHVVICDLSPSHWATDRGLPRHDGAALIRYALDELQRHYSTRSRHDQPPTPEAQAA